MARVDAAWLDGVICRLERCRALRQRLPVMVNDLAPVRDGRLVISCQRSPRTAGGGVDASAVEVSVRIGGAVATVLQEARSPMLVQELMTVLADNYPAAPSLACATPGPALAAAGPARRVLVVEDLPALASAIAASCRCSV